MPANIAQRGASQARSQPPYLFVTRKMGLAQPADSSLALGEAVGRQVGEQPASVNLSGGGNCCDGVPEADGGVASIAGVDDVAGASAAEPAPAETVARWVGEIAGEPSDAALLKRRTGGKGWYEVRRDGPEQEVRQEALEVGREVLAHRRDVSPRQRTRNCHRDRRGASRAADARRGRSRAAQPKRGEQSPRDRCEPSPMHDPTLGRPPLAQCTSGTSVQSYGEALS